MLTCPPTCHRELEAAKTHVGDESWVTSSSLAYKQLQQQLADANTQAQAVLRQLAEAQAAKNECMRLVEGKTQQAEVCVCVCTLLCWASGCVCGRQHTGAPCVGWMWLIRHHSQGVWQACMQLAQAVGDQQGWLSGESDRRLRNTTRVCACPSASAACMHASVRRLLMLPKCATSVVRALLCCCCCTGCADCRCAE